MLPHTVTPNRIPTPTPTPTATLTFTTTDLARSVSHVRVDRTVTGTAF